VLWLLVCAGTAVRQALLLLLLYKLAVVLGQCAAHNRR
jgi:hypothetical protein